MRILIGLVVIYKSMNLQWIACASIFEHAYCVHFYRELFVDIIE